ncbi:MAG: aldehyde dehydrogenase family protein, partial [Pseudomonadota bacterium]|nr:aldehyde dehydrogenase family protein [Pseudomonadota bacterium]
MSQLSHADWQARAAGLSFRNQAFINGQFVPAASGKTFASINPATGDTLAHVAEGDAEDIDRAVAAARKAFDAGHWSRVAPGERKAVLLRLAELIRENLEE